MPKLFIFILSSVGLVYISRASLLKPRSHGFYRFFAWEFIVVLFLLNIDVWLRTPFAWYQLISWFLLLISFIPLAFGIRSLISQGKPVASRESEPQLLSFEKTSSLVTTGIYHYIRHPLYSSLLFLTWGIFFKELSCPGILLASMATIFILATALADEAECIRFFGQAYRTYAKQTKRFIPFLF